MYYLFSLATTLPLICLWSCGGGGSGRGQTSPDLSVDAIATETAIKRPLPSFSAVETYDATGEMQSRVDYFYGDIRLNPSFVEKDAEGRVVKRVDIAVNNEGYVIQRKTSVISQDGTSIKIEDFQRDSENNVVSIFVDTDGQYRRSEIFLSDSGKEIKSQVFNASDQLLSEREIDWGTNSIKVFAYGQNGELTVEWNYKYLMLEMVEGQLRPLFQLSQTKVVSADEGKATRAEGNCEVAKPPIRCLQSFYARGDRLIEKRDSSFYVVPVDNDIYQSHEVMPVTAITQGFEGSKPSFEKTVKRRYGDDFKIMSIETNQRNIGGNVEKAETLFFYDESGRISSEEERVGDQFRYKKIYSY